MAKPPPPLLERTAAARERAREKLMARIPPWYSPWGHLTATTGIGLAVLVLGAWELRAVRLVELLMIPAVFLLANAFEWRVHKNVLHRRLWPVEEIYTRHTPEHHAVYMTNDMAIRSTREFRLVLMPAFGILGIVVATAPVAFGVRLLLGANCGWLFLVSSALYMVGYELSHLSYHLPETTWIGRRPLVKWLREHHARHHDPRLMQKWNFNVTIPLFDWVHGTIAKKSQESLVDDAPGRAEPLSQESAQRV
jgi:Fatty acid hydroxylase superfamily